MIYGIIAAILILLICILFLPLKAELIYKEQMSIRVFFSGIPVYKTVLKGKEKEPSKHPEEKAEKLEKSSKKLGDKIDDFRSFYKMTVKLLKRHVSLEEIKLKVDFGTGEAATTAVLTGVLWGALYGLIGRLGHICYIKNHNVNITPVYNEARFSFEGKCIFKSNIAYIIFIAITILMKIKSRRSN